MDFYLKFFHSFNPAEAGFQFMWAILIIGVFGVAIAFERIVYLFIRSGFKSELFIRDIMNYVQKDDIPSALRLCSKAGRMALAEVIKAGLEQAKAGTENIRNAIDEITLKVIPNLEKRTNYLAMIGNVATLVGLMGTIYGLILSFAAVGKPGIDPAEKATLLASGISAAMYTTLLGLLVAIPAIMLFSFFKSKTQKIVDQIDEQSFRLVNALIESSMKIQKYHINAAEVKEGIGLHVSQNSIKVYTDNKLIKEITL